MKFVCVLTLLLINLFTFEGNLIKCYGQNYASPTPTSTVVPYHCICGCPTTGEASSTFYVEGGTCSSDSDCYNSQNQQGACVSLCRDAGLGGPVSGRCTPF